MKNNKKSASINFKMILIITSIIAVFTLYWYQTKDSLEDTYEIKSAGSSLGYKPSYINRTGKDVEEKKIKLSDGFWSGGKFGF